MNIGNYWELPGNNSSGGGQQQWEGGGQQQWEGVGQQQWGGGWDREENQFLEDAGRRKRAV